MSRFPTCQVCQQHFSLNGPAPFLFPCLHAVCETCLTSADGGVLVCIPCQREVILTEIHLQKDVITEKEILHLTLNHNPELVLCTHEEDGNQAVCWCGDCQHFFCENCQMIHNSFRGSRSHTVQNIGELKTGSFNQDKYCSIHPKFIADTWDKDCCMLTCSTCRRKDHVKHRVIYLDETADSERKEMESLQNSVTETINEQEAHRTATEQDLSSSEQAYDVLPDTITHTFNSLKTLIDQREKEMQIELQQHRDKVLGDLRSKKNTSETSLRRYQTTCDYINKTLQYGSLHDILELRPVLELKSQNCRSSFQSEEYKSHPLPVFKTEGLEKIKSTLAQFGTIAKEFDEIEGGSGSSVNTSAASEYATAGLKRGGGAVGFSFASTTTQQFEGFNFGTQAEAEKKETASSGFNFGTPAADSTKKEGFQFNLGKVSTPVKATEGAKTDTSNFQFTFSLTPSKSPQAKSPQVPKSPDDGYYVNNKNDDSRIYVKPIISLPEKVDLKTGEEEEICHFEQRAKLFRFHDKEWKERGLGTMKILEHKETHRRRLLMRREQILKICCNHIINPELELKLMTTGGECKAWVWFAQDFADEEPKMENFAIRFKTKEIADQFKKEFDAAKALAAGSEPKSEAATGSAAAAVSKKTLEKEDLSGFEYLFSEEATEEQKAEARKYQLPENF